jgi:hypothetical protein
MKRAIPAWAFLALLTATLQQACRRTSEPEYLIATEHLVKHTDSLRTAIENMDTAAITHMHALFLSERPAIEKRFKDTLSPQEAEILGNYHRAMAVTLPRVMGDRKRIEDRLDSSRRRLGNLRHDLEGGLLNKKEQRQAVAVEQAWDSTLTKDVERLRADIAQLEKDRLKYRSAIDPLMHP